MCTLPRRWNNNKRINTSDYNWYNGTIRYFHQFQLHYRLCSRGYSVFYDLEKMGRGRFDAQLQHHLDHAKDVFVLLQEGSLDSCRSDWKGDWFCQEIAYALEKKKNIIPLLIPDYKMPPADFFPEQMKELSFMEGPEFRYAYFDEYLNKLVNKHFLRSGTVGPSPEFSVFKFYSNQDCVLYLDGHLAGCVKGDSDVPYFVSVKQKGDYTFSVVNTLTAESKRLDLSIDKEEHQRISIVWEKREEDYLKDLPNRLQDEYKENIERLLKFYLPFELQTPSNLKECMNAYMSLLKVQADNEDGSRSGYAGKLKKLVELDIPDWRFYFRIGVICADMYSKEGTLIADRSYMKALSCRFLDDEIQRKAQVAVYVGAMKRRQRILDEAMKYINEGMELISSDQSAWKIREDGWYNLYFVYTLKGDKDSLKFRDDLIDHVRSILGQDAAQDMIDTWKERIAKNVSRQG